MSTTFFLRTHPGYVPRNTPGGFGNASAPAVAATPLRRENCAFFFTASGMSEKMRYFFQFMLVQVYQLIFTYQCDRYFWCFISGLPQKKWLECSSALNLVYCS